MGYRHLQCALLSRSQPLTHHPPACVHVYSLFHLSFSHTKTRRCRHYPQPPLPASLNCARWFFHNPPHHHHQRQHSPSTPPPPPPLPPHPLILIESAAPVFVAAATLLIPLVSCVHIAICLSQLSPPSGITSMRCVLTAMPSSTRATGRWVLTLTTSAVGCVERATAASRPSSASIPAAASASARAASEPMAASGC
jgi:hypothetical protein